MCSVSDTASSNIMCRFYLRWEAIQGMLVNPTWWKFWIHRKNNLHLIHLTISQNKSLGWSYFIFFWKEIIYSVHLRIILYPFNLIFSSAHRLFFIFNCILFICYNIINLTRRLCHLYWSILYYLMYYPLFLCTTIFFFTFSLFKNTIDSVLHCNVIFYIIN